MNILKKFKSFFDGTWRDDEYLEKFNEDTKMWYARIQVELDIKGYDVDYVEVFDANGNFKQFPTLIKGLKYIYEFTDEIETPELVLSFHRKNSLTFHSYNFPLIMDIIYKEVKT